MVYSKSGKSCGEGGDLDPAPAKIQATDTLHRTQTGQPRTQVTRGLCSIQWRQIRSGRFVSGRW